MAAPLTRAEQLALLGLSSLPSAASLKVDLNDRERYMILVNEIQKVAGGEPSVPVTTNFAINSTAGGVTLRNSTTPRFVRIVNQGANPITVTYGDTAPLAAVNGVTLAAGDVDESPRPVIGKIRAICGAALTATATIVEF